jgi:CheY-like chemotaxis protein
MQGRVSVESIPNKGSVFRVELNLKPAHPLLNDLANESARDLKGARILIVDSNQHNREMLEREIRGWQGQCLCVATPQQALQQLISASKTNRPYDLAIIDKKMPDMDGIQLAQRIKQANDIRDISLIMLSSVASLTDTGGWMMAGIDGYLSKPVRQDELFSTLSRVLGIEQHLETSSTRAQHDSEKASFNGHILVAEDNPVNSELAAHILDKLGCTYVVAESGQDALDALFNSPLDTLQRPYDLILMDCQMPVLDGYQATRQIRQHEFQQGLGAHIPVIALTANSMPGDRERCLDAGMDDYLSKPFKLEQLSGILQKWLPLIRETNHSEMASPKSQRNVTAASRQSVNSAHIDQAILLKIKSLQREGAPDILHKLIRLYLENSPSMLEKIETAISSGDFDLLRSAAHSLKSCSLSLGALQLGEECRELESVSLKNSLDGLISRLQIIQFEYEGVCRALENQLDSEAA